nr:branched-chain amino acid ABC transporter permease [Psychrobacter sp.]
MNTQSNEINQTQVHSYNWAEGFKKSLPVAMGYLPAGIAFGVLAQVAGIPVWARIMLSAVLY